MRFYYERLTLSFFSLGRYIHSKPFFPLQIKNINTENEILAKFLLSVIVIDTSIVFLDVKPKCFAYWYHYPATNYQN